MLTHPTIWRARDHLLLKSDSGKLDSTEKYCCPYSRLSGGPHIIQINVCLTSTHHHQPSPVVCLGREIGRRSPRRVCVANANWCEVLRIIGKLNKCFIYRRASSGLREMCIARKEQVVDQIYIGEDSEIWYFNRCIDERLMRCYAATTLCLRAWKDNIGIL